MLKQIILTNKTEYLQKEFNQKRSLNPDKHSFLYMTQKIHNILDYI